MASEITHLFIVDLLQHLLLATEEGKLIYEMVMKGTQFASTFIGIILFLGASIVLLGVPGMWPLFGIFALFIGVVIHI